MIIILITILCSCDSKSNDVVTPVTIETTTNAETTTIEETATITETTITTYETTVTVIEPEPEIIPPIPIYEIALAVYLVGNSDNGTLIWQPVRDNVYPDEFYISINSGDNFQLKLNKKMLDGYAEFEITEIQCYDHILKLETPLLYTERTLQIFYDKTNGLYIVGNSFVDYDAVWYYFNRDKIFRTINIPQDDGVELRFFIEDGKIFYEKTNYKFYVVYQSFYFLAELFTTSDEFFLEKGLLDYDDEKIIFDLEIYHTVGEWFHSENFRYKREKLELQANTIEEFLANLYKLEE